MKRLRKKCPRCKEKNMEQALRCTGCGLVFERLKIATNSAAKEMIKKGKGDKVVYVTSTPSDIKRPKLILYSIFGGLFGAHLFYVGRYKKAITMLILGIIFLIGGLLSANSIMPKALGTAFAIATGLDVFMWLLDVFDACIFKFKIPVYLNKEVK